MIFACQLELTQAQPMTRPSFGKKNVTSGAGTSMQNNSNLNSTIDELTDDSGTLDPNTLWMMKGLTDVTQPFWDPYDVDYTRNDRAVQKAFTVQSGKYLSSVVKNSELKSTFVYLKQTLDDVKSIFRYSIQSDGTNTYISREQKGKKILELSMEFNLSQGLDPNVKLGENLRFRYDYVNKRPLFEFGFSF